MPATRTVDAISPQRLCWLISDHEGSDYVTHPEGLLVVFLSERLADECLEASGETEAKVVGPKTWDEVTRQFRSRYSHAYVVTSVRANPEGVAYLVALTHIS